MIWSLSKTSFLFSSIYLCFCKKMLIKTTLRTYLSFILWSSTSYFPYIYPSYFSHPSPNFPQIWLSSKLLIRFQTWTVCILPTSDSACQRLHHQTNPQSNRTENSAWTKLDHQMSRANQKAYRDSGCVYRFGKGAISEWKGRIWPLSYGGRDGCGL